MRKRGIPAWAILINYRHNAMMSIMACPGVGHGHARPISAINRARKGASPQSARLSLQSSELALPAPSAASKCCPPPHWFRGGGTHSLAGEGAGRANSDEGTDTLVLKV